MSHPKTKFHSHHRKEKASGTGDFQKGSCPADGVSVSTQASKAQERHKDSQESLTHQVTLAAELRYFQERLEQERK